MKKVLYVATVLSHICQFHLPYLKMFQDRGYEVHVAARDNLAEKNGMKLQNTDKYFDVPFCRSPFSFKNMKAYKQFKSILRENYDIIVCNTPVGGIVARLAGEKYRRKGTKIIYIAHGFHFYKGGPKKNWVLYYPVEKFFAKRCDVLVTINKEDFLLAQKKFKVEVKQIHGVGVDTTRYLPIDSEVKRERRERLGYSSELFLILVVGELLPNKNQIQAIKAIEEVVKVNDKVKLLIAGNGKERDALEQYVKDRGLENHVEFLGYCTHLENYQCIVDLGVSCSIREGLGLNVIESMMSGNTFVATKNRGHNEIICNGENGFLVDVHDEKALAERILFLIENKEIKEQMEEDALKRSSVYSLENVKKEIENIINIVEF